MVFTRLMVVRANGVIVPIIQRAQLGIPMIEIGQNPLLRMADTLGQHFVEESLRSIKEPVHIRSLHCETTRHDATGSSLPKIVLHRGQLRRAPLVNISQGDLGLRIHQNPDHRFTKVALNMAASKVCPGVKGRLNELLGHSERMELKDGQETIGGRVAIVDIVGQASAVLQNNVNIVLVEIIVRDVFHNIDCEGWVGNGSRTKGLHLGPRGFIAEDDHRTWQ
jgi:hypothetical protein